MNTLARGLAVYLAVVLLDALSGFGLYRNLVHAATGAYCAVANRSSWERADCTARIYYSRPLWLLISLAMGAVGGYVTLQALKSGKW